MKPMGCNGVLDLIVAEPVSSIMHNSLTSHDKSTLSPWTLHYRIWKQNKIKREADTVKHPRSLGWVINNPKVKKTYCPVYGIGEKVSCTTDVLWYASGTLQLPLSYTQPQAHAAVLEDRCNPHANGGDAWSQLHGKCNSKFHSKERSQGGWIFTCFLSSLIICLASLLISNISYFWKK